MLTRQRRVQKKQQTQPQTVYFLQTQNYPTTSITSNCHLSAAKNMCAHAQTHAHAHTCTHIMHSIDPKFSQK